MKYRKKGLHAEPKSDVEKEIRKSQEKIFDNFEKMKTLLNTLYVWECPNCSVEGVLTKSMVNNETRIIKCPVCGEEEMLMRLTKK